jgi:hypothetical protein
MCRDKMRAAAGYSRGLHRAEGIRFEAAARLLPRKAWRGAGLLLHESTRRGSPLLWWAWSCTALAGHTTAPARHNSLDATPARTGGSRSVVAWRALARK